MLAKRLERYMLHISPLAVRADANERPWHTALKTAMTRKENTKTLIRLLVYICHSPWMKIRWWHKTPAAPAASDSALKVMLVCEDIFLGIQARGIGLSYLFGGQ